MHDCQYYCCSEPSTCDIVADPVRCAVADCDFKNLRLLLIDPSCVEANLNLAAQDDTEQTLLVASFLALIAVVVLNVYDASIDGPQVENPMLSSLLQP